MGVKIVGLNWLKDHEFITKEEYEKAMQRLSEKKRAKHSGEPPPGADSGAAAAVEPPAPMPRRIIDTATVDWVRKNAMPPHKGYTVTHEDHPFPGKRKWTTTYPGCNTCSRNYGADKGSAAGRTSIEAMNCVLN